MRGCLLEAPVVWFFFIIVALLPGLEYSGMVTSVSAASSQAFQGLITVASIGALFLVMPMIGVWLLARQRVFPVIPKTTVEDSIEIRGLISFALAVTGYWAAVPFVTYLLEHAPFALDSSLLLLIVFALDYSCALFAFHRSRIIPALQSLLARRVRVRRVSRAV